MNQSKSESKITKVITVSGNERVTVLDLPAQKDLLLEMLENLSSETRFEDYVFVRKGFGHKKVKVVDVIYLEAQQNYCNLFMIDGTKLTVTMPMNRCMSILIQGVSKECIVRLSSISNTWNHMKVTCL